MATANNLECYHAFGHNVGAEVSGGTSLTLFDKLNASLGVLSGRRCHSFIALSSLLPHLLVNLDQLSDVELGRCLRFLADRLHVQNAAHNRMYHLLLKYEEDGRAIRYRI